LESITNLHRRGFLRAALAGVGTALITPAWANLIPTAEQKLRLYHTHTGEKLEVIYKRQGRYISTALEEINRLCRDHRSGEVYTIDPGLLDQLHTLQSATAGPDACFEIISAYRSPKTNTMLRRTGSGVAKRSLHMQGKAIDVRLTNHRLSKLHRAALAMKAGGVGYYPKSGFLHLDTGRVRAW